MNRGQLKTKVIAESKRANLSGVIDEFIDDAESVVNDRFGLELSTSADSDINDVLRYHWLLYFYPAMRRVNEFEQDWDTAIRYDELWIKTANRMNSTNLEANEWVNPKIAIWSEAEVAAAEDA